MPCHLFSLSSLPCPSGTTAPHPSCWFSSDPERPRFKPLALGAAPRHFHGGIWPLSPPLASPRPPHTSCLHLRHVTLSFRFHPQPDDVTVFCFCWCVGREDAPLRSLAAETELTPRPRSWSQGLSAGPSCTAGTPLPMGSPGGRTALPTVLDACTQMLAALLLSSTRPTLHVG